MRRIAPSARLFLALVLGAPGAFACPACRDALARADARWAQGFGLSVAFLLAALLVVAGSFSFALWRSLRS